MDTVAAPDEVVRASPRRRGAREEIRCPSCARPLVLRSGPAITPHYAHRPRQSCRNRPGGAPLTPLRLEQLTLFDLETLPAPAGPAWLDPFETILDLDDAPRRRRAWLPRLIRWVKARSAG